MVAQKQMQHAKRQAMGAHNQIMSSCSFAEVMIGAVFIIDCLQLPRDLKIIDASTQTSLLCCRVAQHISLQVTRTIHHAC